MASNLTLTANFVDTNKPTMSITNLASGQRVSNAVFTVKGRASDNWQLSNVVCHSMAEHGATRPQPTFGPTGQRP